MRPAIGLLALHLVACRRDSLPRDQSPADALSTDLGLVPDAATLADQSAPTSADAGFDAGPDTAGPDAVAAVDVAPDALLPPRRAVTGFLYDFWDSQRFVTFAPTLTSPRSRRMDFFAIVSPSGALWQTSNADTIVTTADDRLAPLQVTAGVDATSWGADRLDLVARDAQGRVWHSWAGTTPASRWESERLGDDAGVYRPTVVHLGPGKLVAFQVTAQRTVSFNVFDRNSWAGWKPGPPGRVSSDLDATTLVRDGQPAGARLVALDEEGRVVTAGFSAGDGVFSAWERVQGEPAEGVKAGPAIASFGQSPAEYTVFVASASGRLFERAWDDRGADAMFIPVAGADQHFGAIDVVAGVWDGKERIDLVRINRETGHVQTNVLGIDKR